MIRKKHRPPRISTFILELMLFYSISSAALGDLEELYHILCKEKGRIYARFWYRFQILTLLPTFIVDSIYWGTAMFRSYLKSAMRIIGRNKMTSVVNILGLSAAISCAIFAYVFIDWQYSMEDFHENKESVFLLCNYVDIPGEGSVLYGNAPAPLGPESESALPQVEKAVRIFYERTVFRYEGLEFEETLNFVDNGYMDIFTFPLAAGDPGCLSDISKIILSADAADKYFGDSDPIGRQIQVTFSNKETVVFTVGGVAGEFPNNSSFKFNALISSEKIRELKGIEPTDWTQKTYATFIKLNNPESADNTAKNLEQYIPGQNESDPERKITSFHLEPLETLSQNAYRISRCIAGGSHVSGRYMLAVIAFMVLASACFNFINTAVASVTRRLKEIGVRKIVGSSKSQMILQHIFENMLLCFAGLILGIILCETVMIPGFNSLAGEELFTVNYLENIGLWVFLAGLLMLTSIGAGGYPAFFVSRLKPVDILARKRQAGYRTMLSRVSLTFQFFLSFFTVYTGVAYTMNHLYQLKLDWGYEGKNVIAVPVNGSKHFSLYEDALSNNPGILKIAGTVHQIGLTSPVTEKAVYGQTELETGRFSIGKGYFDLMNIDLKEGTSLSGEDETQNSILVNEMFVHSLGISSPVGEEVRIGEDLYSIKGVVHDFHYRTFTNTIEPVVIKIASEDQFNYMAVLAQEGALKPTGDFLREEWTKLFPETAFQQKFIADVATNYHRQTWADLKVFGMIAFINLAIASMGLLGLVSLNCSKKEKEISIRKVLGASVGSVVKILNREFLISFIISMVVAVPVSYWAINSTLNFFYAYRVDLGVTTTLMAVVLIIVTSALTIAGHVLRTAKLNPVDLLRND